MSLERIAPGQAGVHETGARQAIVPGGLGGFGIHETAISAIAFSGTIGGQIGTQSASFSFDAAPYFTGSATPFTFALQAGALPAGLSLSSAGLISGTPTTPGVSSGLVVRGTDADTATADTNSFSITINAAASGVPIVVVMMG